MPKMEPMDDSSENGDDYSEQGNDNIFKMPILFREDLIMKKGFILAIAVFFLISIAS